MPHRSHLLIWITLVAGTVALAASPTVAQSSASQSSASQPSAEEQAAYIRSHYTKYEYQIPMRDGVRLFTAVYVPSVGEEDVPILMVRTPYSCSPYGADQYRTRLGPHFQYAKDGYIFVFQDVRGKYMSEGTFVNMRPHVAEKTSKKEIDESTDTYDTIGWLLGHVDGHNGRVGMWGISYPGFYTAAGMIDSHPALQAVSPQAPIADWFWDDFHHHGALFLPHGFNFLSSFGKSRPGPTTEGNDGIDHGTPDGYQFFLDMGPLKNANEKYLKSEVAFWNDICAHPNYDEFWQSRNLLPHLKNIHCAVLTVGGWFDAEDLYGALKIYRDAERNNPSTWNALVMGPWAHGGWASSDGSSLGNAQFGFNASEWYRENVEWPFFRHHLKGEKNPDLPEATVFETGANRWRQFDHWPPAEAQARTLYIGEDGALGWSPPKTEGFDQYISDPKHPVPFTEVISKGMTREYMTADQRFASRRPDVVTYQTEVLDEDVTLVGPIEAHLWVSTTGSASDWVVKVIDVLPPDTKDPDPNPTDLRMGNYEMMIRSEVIRGRFRNSYEFPEPFTPNEPTLVKLELQDVCHDFKRGHRIMIQIQSTWFPLVDRNPHRYVENIYLGATEEDFVVAMQRVHRSREHPTQLRVSVLPSADRPAGGEQSRK